MYLQGVQNMIRLLFVPDAQLHVFHDLSVIHGKPKVGQLSQLGCPDTAAVVGDETHEADTYVTPTSVLMLIRVRT
jgi:hypothetical protein